MCLYLYIHLTKFTYLNFYKLYMSDDELPYMPLLYFRMVFLVSLIRNFFFKKF